MIGSAFLIPGTECEPPNIVILSLIEELVSKYLTHFINRVFVNSIIAGFPVNMWKHGPVKGNLDETQPLYDESMRTEQETKEWDLFQDPPRKLETGSMADTSFFDTSEKVMKLVAYILTFAVVLASAVISKGTLLFMTSQVNSDTKAYCNRELGDNKQLVVTLPPEERVAWIWLLFYAYCVPQVGTFIRSLRICVFKTWNVPPKTDILILFVTETLPSIGSALLVFCVLPELDVIKGAMLTNAVCFIPGIVGFITRNPSCPKNGLNIVLDIVSIVAQASSFVVWPLVMDKPVLWLIPVSVTLISFGWWENYVSEDSPIKIVQKYAAKLKEFESNDKYFAYLFLSLWKCLVFFLTMLTVFHVKEGDVKFLFKLYHMAFNDHGIFVKEIEPVIDIPSGVNLAEMITTGPGTTITTNYMTPIWVFLINIGSTYICYVFGKFACKVWIQGFSYAFPINLTMPVVLSGLIAMCSEFVRNECAFADSIPYYLFFDTPHLYYLNRFLGQEQAWIWLVWLLSQTWITVHIWSPTCEKQDRTEKLYVRPMYHAFLIDQDIALNRRRDDVKKNEEKPIDETGMDSTKDNTTRIYACGTMWHETKEEMMEFLKSIMRLDFDQSARELVREKFDFDRPDYYQLETHVFFDDAFIRKYPDDPDPQINEFVKDLVTAVSEAASIVHETNVEIRAPKKYVTPYGGQLVWTLPGKTRMVTHLKDKKKIRAKKRWSQVMYMYYLLGHRLMEKTFANDESDSDRKEVIAENTYILALDGDIDFQPKAVTLLVDLMKRNKTLGAACGRIHPMGSGPMVWYQMFEYAVGHWLQKATEHMIGCVLCSPGCFSLFRGKALMDYNVMKKYTTKSSEAIHYVQYDQGEDRWLCTLLLQRGYRVEYSAASDAYTHCPEGFNEFYNQRRRWMPSTTANIMDLLMDYKHTISVNDNISRLYIMYQVILMVGTILGPGTIFLMLVGAFVAAFQMGQWQSFMWNVVPIMVFMFVCKVFKKDNIQLFFAGLISAVYGLVMMAVLVGVMLQISQDGPLAPSSLFFFCVAGEMIVTALLHPKELNCLVYGVVYYVTVPSMYMLLVIYSVFNMNNVSWGTREVTVMPQSSGNNEPTQPTTKEDTLKDKVMNFFSQSKDERGSFDFSISGLFRCMLCTHEINSVEKYQLEQIKMDINTIMKKLDNISRGVQEEEPTSSQRRKTVLIEGSKASEKTVTDEETESELSVSFSIDEGKNSWLDDEVLAKGETDFISNEENDFWKGLLDKYLHPIDDTKDKARIAQNLMDLRDKAVAAFFMLNALFVLIVFLLTLKKDLLHIKWPFGVKANFTYHADVDQFTMVKSYLQLEPIGLVFLFFFAILLVVQFIAMLFHRFATLCQILSNTNIEFSLFKKADDISPDEMFEKNAVNIAKQMQKLKNVDGTENEKEERAGRRKTIAAMAKSAKNNRKSVVFLDEAFSRRKTLIEQHKTPDHLKSALKKSSIAGAMRRRTTVVENRKSIGQRLPFQSGPHDNPAFVKDN